MAWLLLFACAVAFLFGLVQWARSGALLWDIIRIPGRGVAKPGVPGENADGSESLGEKRLRELESMTDRLLRSSFRVLGILAVCVWLFVIASVVFDILGIDWMDRLSFQARNRLWGDPSMRAGGRVAPMRNSVIRSLGSGLR